MPPSFWKGTVLGHIKSLPSPLRATPWRLPGDGTGEQQGPGESFPGSIPSLGSLSPAGHLCRLLGSGQTQAVQTPCPGPMSCLCPFGHGCPAPRQAAAQVLQAPWGMESPEPAAQLSFPAGCSQPPSGPHQRAGLHMHTRTHTCTHEAARWDLHLCDQSLGSPGKLT